MEKIRKRSLIFRNPLMMTSVKDLVEGGELYCGEQAFEGNGVSELDEGGEIGVVVGIF
jgi:hypothetical protein